MRVRVRLYASLRRFAPEGQSGSHLEVDLSEGAKLQDLVKVLKIPPEETRVAFVNGITRDMDWVLSPGDEVGMFPPIGGGASAEIIVDTWLYGELAEYAQQMEAINLEGNDTASCTALLALSAGPGYANLRVALPEGSTISNLLSWLKMPGSVRGITFINGELSAMPGLQPDLDHPLKDGDRVAFFHLRAMWPFQYRTGVPMVREMSSAMVQRNDAGLRHAYSKEA